MEPSGKKGVGNRRALCGFRVRQKRARATNPAARTQFDRFKLCGLGGFRLALAAFQDLLANVLGGGLDVLHFLAHARSGRFISAGRFADIFRGFFD